MDKFGFTLKTDDTFAVIGYSIETAKEDRAGGPTRPEFREEIATRRENEPETGFVHT